MIRKQIVIYIGIALLIIYFISWLGLNELEKDTKLSVAKSLQAVLGSTNDAYRQWAIKEKRQIQAIASKPEFALLVEQLLISNKKSKQALIALRRYLSKIIYDNYYQGFFIISPEYMNLASMRDSNLYTQNLIYQQRPALLKKFLRRGKRSLFRQLSLMYH